MNGEEVILHGYDKNVNIVNIIEFDALHFST